MSEQTSKKRLINTIKAQLESELVMGGKWLPVGKIDLTAAVKPQKDRPVEQTQEVKVSSPADTKVVAQKHERLEAVAAAVNKCTKCPLYETRTQGVPGEGNPNARLVFVGEAPGADEDAQGRPFVGRAGKLLTSIIEAMGLKRQDVFIGNILKSRPPGNRDPQITEITACIDYLYEQFDIIEPEIIVALGAYAARTLLDSTESIGKLRGRVHDYYPTPMHAPIKLIATYHPAYLLRNYSVDTRRRVWEDMKLVLRELQLPLPQGRK